jgi:4-alpha-glucanotransferase
LGTRGSGLLFHITSLPSPYGIGDLGPEAHKFADLLVKAKQKYWQILPLNLPIAESGYSPYFSNSAFAGNYLLVSLDLLVEEGLLTPEDIGTFPGSDTKYVNYDRVVEHREAVLDKVYERFKKGSGKSAGKKGYKDFCIEQSGWLDDFALFTAIKEEQGGRIWRDWPEHLRDRHPEALKKSEKRLAKKIDKEKFLQYLVFRQWFSLKSYCNKKGIRIIGDIPIYVSYDSADVWMNPHIFKLNENKKPIAVSGVPPDYFSATGQLWNNPVYRWDVLKETGYGWWIKRLEHTFSCVDILRIDHFRGLVQYWEIPAGEETAINGKWLDVPTYDFFDTLLAHFKEFPVIAEDLGHITPDVKEAMKHYGFPGMRVLQFAFGEGDPKHPYLPQNYITNCVAYPGTHDNNTMIGWLREEAPPEVIARVLNFLGEQEIPGDANWRMIERLMESVADTVIIPVQDIIGLGSDARMNKPREAFGNWKWRLLPYQLTQSHAEKLLKITESSGRS